MPYDPPQPSTGSFASRDWSGTYVGVPDGYHVLAGYRQSYAPDYSNGYQGQVPGLTHSPVYREPIYTYNDVVALRGKSNQQIMANQIALYNAGYLSSSFRYGVYDESTETAMKEAMADANASGKSLGDLFSAIASGQKGLRGASSGGGGGGGGGGGPRTITSTSVNLTGRAGAQSVLIQALTAQLGREPSKGEVSRFMRSLNAEERANPTVSTTHISAGGATQSTTTKQSDVDPSMEAEDWAKNKSNKKERQKYQDALYYDVISSMLSGG